MGVYGSLGNYDSEHLEDYCLHMTPHETVVFELQDYDVRIESTTDFGVLWVSLDSGDREGWVEFFTQNHTENLDEALEKWFFGIYSDEQGEYYEAWLVEEISKFAGLWFDRLPHKVPNPASGGSPVTGGTAG